MRKLLCCLLLVAALLSASALAADADTETTLWPAYDPVTGLWGYIREDGAWEIAPQWERAYHFHGGCAIVDTEDVPSWEGKSTQGIIDETGAYLLAPEYSIDDACCLDGAGALYLVADDEKMGWFNIPNRYFSGLHWTECHAVSDTPYIEINMDYSVSGLADRATGEVVVPVEYSYTCLSDWGSQDGFIVAEPANTDGCELIEIGVGVVELPEGVYLDYVESVSDGLVPYSAENGLSGYINTAGEVVIEAQFDWARAFVGGYAEVNLPEDVGTRAVIDRTGRVIATGLAAYFGVRDGALFVEWPDETWGLIEPDGTIRCRHTLPEDAYDVWLYEFSSDGPIWLEYSLGDDDYLWGLMSRDGELLGDPQWQSASRGGDLVTVCEGGTWGYVDLWGNTVLPFIYEAAGHFEGALAYVMLDASTEAYINRSGEVVYQWASPGDEW